MSAFLCNPTHVGKLASFYQARERWSKTTAQDAAEILAKANLASVSYRYDDLSTWDKTAQEFLGYEEDIGAAEAYIQECQTEARKLDHNLSSLHAYTMAQCSDYQSCEVPDWLGSEAWGLLEGIKSAAIRAMPGYDEAPWEYRESKPAHK